MWTMKQKSILTVFLGTILVLTLSSAEVAFADYNEDDDDKYEQDHDDKDHDSEHENEHDSEHEKESERDDDDKYEKERS